MGIRDIAAGNTGQGKGGIRNIAGGNFDEKKKPLQHEKSYTKML
jgi:hypothetical protein